MNGINDYSNTTIIFDDNDNDNDNNNNNNDNNKICFKKWAVLIYLLFGFTSIMVIMLLISFLFSRYC